MFNQHFLEKNPIQHHQSTTIIIRDYQDSNKIQKEIIGLQV